MRVNINEDTFKQFITGTNSTLTDDFFGLRRARRSSTKLIWKPTMTTELDLEGMQKLMKLVDALEDDDDVQRVTSNFEASDEVMDQL